MDPVRSSIGGGLAATAVLTLYLLVVDLLVAGDNPFVFATFTSLCAVGGPPYCAADTPMAAALTFFWFVVLFGLAWPLLFGGFTWGIPGESGPTHGAIFGLVLWAGYLVGTLGIIGRFGQSLGENVPLFALTLLGYLVYGIVLGGVYDRLAGHRTFLSGERDTPSPDQQG
jgi:hypothetical protein